MITTQPISALAEALAAAHVEITNPHKNREVTVQPREGRAYQFQYATLDSILDGVRPILAKNGLSIIQTMVIIGENHTPAMRTALLHKSGESICTDVPMTIDRPGNQALGSAMTYARRYGLIGLLALAADEDDDGNEADGNTVQGKNDKPTKTHAQAPIPAKPNDQQAQATQAQHQPAVSPAKVEFAALRASLISKLGGEEADHQIATIKKRHGTAWQKAMAEIRALDESTPKPKG